MKHVGEKYVYIHDMENFIIYKIKSIDSTSYNIDNIKSSSALFYRSVFGFLPHVKYNSCDVGFNSRFVLGSIKVDEDTTLENIRDKYPEVFL